MVYLISIYLFNLLDNIFIFMPNLCIKYKKESYLNYYFIVKMIGHLNVSFYLLFG